MHAFGNLDLISRELYMLPGNLPLCSCSEFHYSNVSAICCNLEFPLLEGSLRTFYYHIGLHGVSCKIHEVDSITLE